MKLSNNQKSTIESFFENMVGCSIDIYSTTAKEWTETLIDWLEET